MRKILFLLTCLTISFFSFAQQKITISGNVISETNTPLPGVSVKAKKASGGTTTDAQGRYSLQVNKSDVVTFSYVGYEAKEFKVNSENGSMAVQLTSATAALADVVVIGYGTARKKDVSGSVSTISAKDIRDMPVASFDLALQGRAPGLQVPSASAEPGGGVNVRIRGNTSISGNNNPLIVLDGYPLPESGEAANDRGNPQTSNFLSFLNPAEIESVEILKDASATAIYGARGSNGVIMVTTRKGKNGIQKIDISNEVGVSNVTNLTNLMRGTDWATWRNELAVKFNEPLPYDGVLNPLPANATNVDWLNAITRKAAFQRHQITLTGGNDKTRYSVSGNMFKQDGILLSSTFKLANLRVNLDNQLSKNLSLSITVSYARTFNDRSQGSTRDILTASPIFDALRANPAVKGGINFVKDDLLLAEPVFNPITQLNYKKDQTLNKEFFFKLCS